MDPTLPGIRFNLGSIHPITTVIEEICQIFEHIGFTVVEGPEIETDYYNFQALNIPPGHPARDDFATFYLPCEQPLPPHIIQEISTSAEGSVNGKK